MLQGFPVLLPSGSITCTYNLKQLFYCLGNGKFPSCKMARFNRETKRSGFNTVEAKGNRKRNIVAVTRESRV